MSSWTRSGETQSGIVRTHPRGGACLRALFARVLYVAWRGPGTAARGNVCAMVAHRIAMRPSPVHAAGTPRRHRH